MMSKFLSEKGIESYARNGIILLSVGLIGAGFLSPSYYSYFGERIH